MTQEKDNELTPLPIVVLGLCVEEQLLVPSVFAYIFFWVELV
jgi:hypothetical protein